MEVKLPGNREAGACGDEMKMCLLIKERREIVSCMLMLKVALLQMMVAFAERDPHKKMIQVQFRRLGKNIANVYANAFQAPVHEAQSPKKS